MSSTVVYEQWLSLSTELAKAAEEVGKSVVCIQSQHRHAASGVIWQKGVVVTANHTLTSEEPTIIDAQGRSFTAKLAGQDPTTDLAVLRIPENAQPGPASIGEAKELQIGNLVLGLGRTRRGNLVASSGIISGLMGAWRTWRGGEIEQFIRPDLVLYPGFSGGPLVDATGRVVGVNSQGLRRGAPITIPSSTVSRVARELLEKGHIARPYLGLAMQPVALPQELRNKLNLFNASGALIMHVEPEGPAARASLMLGDILTAIKGNTVEDTDDVQLQLGKSRVGESVVVSFIRGGQRLEASVELGDRASK